MRNLEQKTHGAREKGKLLGAGGASTWNQKRNSFIQVVQKKNFPSLAIFGTGL